MSDNNAEPRKRGRPPLPMPEPIDDTPENVARAILNVPPKKPGEWRYLKEWTQRKR